MKYMMLTENSSQCFTQISFLVKANSLELG